MAQISAGYETLDMTSWAFPSLKALQWGMNSDPAWIELSTDGGGVWAFASLIPEADTIYVRLTGPAFGEFDAKGVPHSGVVEHAVLLTSSYSIAAEFGGLSLSVNDFLVALGSQSPSQLTTLLNSGDDTLHGLGRDVGKNTIEPLGDHLLGGLGNDSIFGHGGHDTLEGGAGDDIIHTVDRLTNAAWQNKASMVDGGQGHDTISYEDAPFGVTVSLAGDVGTDTVSNVEVAIGSAFGDTLSGSAAADTLFGFGGDDRLDGGDGADTLLGDDGNDTVSGGAGDDVIDGGRGSDQLSGGDGIDTLSYKNATIGVTLDLQAQTANSSGNDAVFGFERVEGGIYSDTLAGSTPGETLSGGAGDDSISGRDGDDTLIGGDGSNTLFGDAGNDSIQGGAGYDRTNGNQGDDTVHGAAGDDWVTGGQSQDVLFGDEGNDILNGNLGADTSDGGIGNDTVRGGQGDDVLSGGEGNDLLTGDLGDDTLSGGAGADAFRAFAGGGHDVIADFHAGEGDRIVLDPGTTYTAARSGADVVVDLGGGAQTVLKNVTLTALPAGWIVGG